MGRIRSKWIKKTAALLISQYPDKFDGNFEKNKKALEGLALIDDKPIRNKLAGYITTLKTKTSNN